MAIRIVPRRRRACPVPSTAVLKAHVVCENGRREEGGRRREEGGGGRKEGGERREEKGGRREEGGGRRYNFKTEGEEGDESSLFQYFYIDSCGDGVCNANETCTSCKEDCTCVTSKSPLSSSVPSLSPSHAPFYPPSILILFIFSFDLRATMYSWQL